MSKLNDVIHFRGETVTLFATFKEITAEGQDTPSGVLSPVVRIDYVDNNGVIQTALPSTEMTRISIDRYFALWTIPEDALMTTYSVKYDATIGDKSAFATEDLIVGNPNITRNRSTLRYGPHSVLQRPADATPRKPLALPNGEF